MSELKDTIARVRGMQAIEDELRATLRRRGLKVREKDVAWNRDRPYDALPETLELSIKANGGPPALQAFTHDEVIRCARTRDPAVSAKIQAMAEHVQALNGRKRNG